MFCDLSRSSVFCQQLLGIRCTALFCDFDARIQSLICHHALPQQELHRFRIVHQIPENRREMRLCGMEEVLV